MMIKRIFSAGDTLFREGEPSKEAYLLRSGRVDVLKDAPSGPLRLAILGAGDVVGEMGLLDDRVRSATARALDDVVADAIGPAEFSHLLLHEPSRSLDLLRALFERLRSANQMLAQYADAKGPPTPLPHATLMPLTVETQAVLPPDGILIDRFPFRVGRTPASSEEGALSFNELEVKDHTPFTLSLNHFAVELAPQGLQVRDRGSQQETVVNRLRIGNTALRDIAVLRPGDNEIVAGAPSARRRAGAPFRFRLVLG